MFVGVKGYVVTPLLNQARLRESLQDTPASTETSSNSTATWGAMRLHHTLDSTLSGGVTGGIWNTWRRACPSNCSWPTGLDVLFKGGTCGALTGMMFGSVFCAVGQLLYNELGVQRVKYVSRTGPAASLRPPSPISSEVTELPVPKETFFDRMIHAIGLKRISDEQYLAQLREQRAAYLRKIAELEAKVQADEDS